MASFSFFSQSEDGLNSPNANSHNDEEEGRGMHIHYDAAEIVRIRNGASAFEEDEWSREDGAPSFDDRSETNVAIETTIAKPNPNDISCDTYVMYAKHVPDDDDKSEGDIVCGFFCCCCTSRFLKWMLLVLLLAAIATGVTVGVLHRRNSVSKTTVAGARGGIEEPAGEDNSNTDSNGSNDNDNVGGIDTNTDNSDNEGEGNGEDGANDGKGEGKDKDPDDANTDQPTLSPTSTGTTSSGSREVSSVPTSAPTNNPTALPTSNPTTMPTKRPTTSPTSQPTATPTQRPTSMPTSSPTTRPTSQPTATPTQRPTSMPTSSPTTRPTAFKSSGAELTVGVYYYPWHGNNFHGRRYLRQYLQPRHFPELGEYDDSKPETVTQHLKWSRQANVNLWVTSWWGPDSREDKTTKDVILPHEDLGDMKIALHYETTGRMKDNLGGYNTDRAFDDIIYMCDNYFSHPNYYHIDGRPVLVLYITRWVENRGLLSELISQMRAAGEYCGTGVYLIGDHVFNSPPPSDGPYLPLLYLDGVTNYDVYGAMRSPTYYAGEDVVNAYFDVQNQWRTRAREHNCAYIPAVSPGFNDRGVRLEVDHQPLSRRLTPDSEPGSLFRYALRKARHTVDETSDNLILINSFNEWHEDSQIEPVAVGPASASEPFDMTKGVEYEAYGELYLNILRDETVTE